MVRTILRLPAVCVATGYRKTRIYTLMRLGEFPAAVRLGPQAIGWYADEIEAWQESLPRVYTTGQAAENTSAEFERDQRKGVR